MPPRISELLGLLSMPHPSLSLSLSLVLPLCLWGIAHSSLQKRHQVRSARVRRNTIFDNSAPLAKYSAHILVPPPRQTPAQCGFFRSHPLVICAAKPRYTAAAAREHRRVLALSARCPSSDLNSGDRGPTMPAMRHRCMVCCEGSQPRRGERRVRIWGLFFFFSLKEI